MSSRTSEPGGPGPLDPLGPSGATRSLGLALPALVLTLGAFVARRELAPEGIGIDDAYIFLRYGRNLAEGAGWVWNPGGPPVEGFSSILWTLVVALVHRVTAAPETPLVLLSLALVAAGLALWSRASAPRAPLASGVVLAAWLASEPSFAVWTAVTLMDSGLWCAVLLATAASLVRLARDGSRAAVGWAAGAQLALSLTRPEALLVGPLAIAVAARAAGPPWRRFAPPAVAAVAAQLALLGWRLAVFGVPLPNTYYAKVDESLRVRIAGGARYLGAALAEEPTRALVAAVALAAVLALVFAPRRLERVFDVRDAGERAALALAAALPLGAAAIALAEGGDGFPGQRILVAFRPFEATLLFLAARAAYRWRRALASEARAAAAVVVVALVGHFAGDARWGALEPTTYHGRDWLAARSGFELGERLERLFGAGSERPLVGVLAAGAAAYTYSGPSRDLLALNDPVMAHATRRRRGFHGHSAFSARGFFADPPVLFPLAALHCTGDPAERTARQHVLRGMGGIDRDPRFVRAYRLVQIDAPATGEPTLCTYARIDWLEGAGRPWRWSPVDDRPRAERQAAAARARIAAERPKGAG